MKMNLRSRDAVSIESMFIGEHPSILVVGDIVEVSMFNEVRIQGKISPDDNKDWTSRLVVLIVGEVFKLESGAVLRIEVIHASAELIQSSAWVRRLVSFGYVGHWECIQHLIYDGTDIDGLLLGNGHSSKRQQGHQNQFIRHDVERICRLRRFVEN